MAFYDEIQYIGTREDINVNIYRCNLSIDERKEYGFDMYFICVAEIFGDDAVILFPEFYNILEGEVRECILQHEIAYLAGCETDEDADKYAIEHTSDEAFQLAQCILEFMKQQSEESKN